MTPQEQALQRFVDGSLYHGSMVRVLEAGCGSASFLRFNGTTQLVGIDISAKQLERNTVLHEKIIGDIQSYEHPAESYDAIVCWDVLEHLREPELALKLFARAIKPGGLVILKMPNVLSLKGLVTKLMPHFVHVLAYRYFFNEKDAGKEDTLPFRTFLRLSISERRIRKQGEQLGLKTVFFASHDVSDFRWLKEKPIIYVPYLTLKGLLWAASLGRIGDSELMMVLQK